MVALIKRKNARNCSTFVLLLLVTILLGCIQRPAPTPVDGAALFNNKCAACHRNDNDMRAPESAALKEMSRRSILTALEAGEMKREGRTLSYRERVAIANYLGRPEAAITARLSDMCMPDVHIRPDAPVWAGWGVNRTIRAFNLLRSPSSIVSR